MLSKIIKICKLTITLICIVIFTLFVFNNTTKTTINLWPFSTNVEIRVFLLIIFVFILGMLFSMLINFIKNGLDISKIKDSYKIKQLEKEVNNLKNNYDKNEEKTINNN
ncbi:MAG: LapA family protein [Rickettsiales bacterium]|nr:LapA family protein [Rickettsiales bacterium]